MILAAGRGERLRPLTDHTPKPLLRVGAKRLIEYTLERLASAGLTRIIINHAHLGNQIVSALGDGQRYGLCIRYSAEPPGALETAGGIVNALPLIESDPFVVVNGDIYTDYPFARLPHDLAARAHVVLVDNPPHNPAGDFVLRAGRVLPRASAPRHAALTFSGIAVYQRALFAGRTAHRAPLGPLLAEAAADGHIAGEHYQGTWFDVGDPERLRALSAQLAHEADAGA